MSALWCGLAIMGRDCSRVEGKRRSDVFHTEECERMMRQWLKILVLVLALLSQMAMTCPRDSGSLGSEGPPPARGGY